MRAIGVTRRLEGGTLTVVGSAAVGPQGRVVGKVVATVDGELVGAKVDVLDDLTAGGKSEIGVRGERGGPAAGAGLPPLARRILSDHGRPKGVSHAGPDGSIRALGDRVYRGPEELELVVALREALRVALGEGVKRAEVARRLGCGVDAIEAWVAPSRATRIPAETLIRLVGVLPPGAAGVLRAAVVGLLERRGPALELRTAAMSAAAEAGDVHREIVEAMSDGIVEPGEARRIALEAWEAEDAMHRVAEEAQRAMGTQLADVR